MGWFDKLLGGDEDAAPTEKPDGGSAGRAPAGGGGGAAQAQPAKGKVEPPARAEPSDGLGAVPPVPKEVRTLLNAALEHVERTAASFGEVLEKLQALTGMLQAVAKSGARADQERKQQFLDLRAHLTAETDRLIASMREEATREASVEVFRAVLPALDEVDHVLRENEAGAEVRAESIRILRRRLRDALSRLGIEETPVAKRETMFDAELHEGRPYEGDPAAIAGLPAHVVVDVERNGWTGFGKVLRHAQVIVVKE